MKPHTLLCFNKKIIQREKELNEKCRTNTKYNNKKTVLALIFIMIDSINIVHHCFQCPYIAYIQQTKKKFLSM